MHIPEGYNQLMPYLIIDNADQFAMFTEKVFGGRQQQLHLRDDGKTIMHAEININGQVIMYAAATPEYPVMPAGLFIYVDDADSSYQSALSNGASTVMELSDQPYGRTCGIKDPCGNTWWITSV